MAAARYLGNKKEGMISMKASLMKKLHYSSSPYVHYADRVSQQKERRGEEDLDDEKSTIEYVEENAKEGVRKVTEIADGAKRNLDGTWESTKAKIFETVNENENEEDQVVDQIKKLDGPVDTVDYRNIKEDTNL